ncbi:hypothetical protein PIB30_083771 [Stylosanthes scabra]|uniref:DUF1985 domain-containing protein n=1 Tax=Stylosanthes scabra TaxID=79078 RepID=A0ABU6WV35_9FABA|nr:hypothetical protein [Stylosanthes scabra]
MRCSPSELAKTYAVLSNEKKALVHEMGFGALAENVSNYNFSNLIMMELVDSFHIPDNTIRTNIGRFKVDATKVGHALGLNATGGLYRQKMLKKEVPPEQYEAADKYRKKSLADLRDMVTQIQLDTEEGITNFKRAFILYVQKAVLCPNNSKPLSPKTLPTILDVTNPRAMNWGRHVYSFLLNGITEMKKKNLKSADGYVFALLIIYFQETHFGVDSEEPDAQPPWLVYWKDSMLKQRIKYEFEDPAPPRQGKADTNPDATIDALPDPSTQVNVNQEDHTKDADSAFAMTVGEDDTQHNVVIVDETIATAPPKDTIPASEEEVTPIFDASIAEPSRMTATGVESAEEENTHQNATLAGEKESMAVPREPEKAEPTQRDLADSGEYLNFTQPSFKLLSSQDEPQQEEIRGEEVKVVGPVNEPSSQEFEEEIIYTQGTLDRLDKEMNDAQMKIAEKKLERILK